jgi:very-short-patch-repair endonuclease
MFTGVFKDRSAKERVAKEAPRELIVAAEQALAEMLSSRELRAHPLSRNCEVGPFLIDYLFPQKSLIIELAPALLSDEPSPSGRQQARLKFLGDMGYTVFAITPREILRDPQRTLAKVRAVLEQGKGS